MLARLSGSLGSIWPNSGTTRVAIRPWVALPLRYYTDMLQESLVFNHLMLLLYRILLLGCQSMS